MGQGILNSGIIGVATAVVVVDCVAEVGGGPDHTDVGHEGVTMGLRVWSSWRLWVISACWAKKR